MIYATWFGVGLNNKNGIYRRRQNFNSSTKARTWLWSALFYEFLVHFLGLMPAFQPTQRFQQCVFCHCQVYAPLCSLHRSSSITESQTTDTSLYSEMSLETFSLHSFTVSAST